MKKINLIFFLTLCVLLGLQAQNKKDYKIDIKIKGIEDSVLYLANYYGDKTFLIDTALRKGKNNYLFEGNNELAGGIYILVGQSKNTIFEFLISDSQFLKFDSETDNLIEDMEVKGSNENTLFFRYLAYSNIQFKQLKNIQKKLKLYAAKPDSVNLFNKQITALNLDIVEYKESIIEAYPKSFISQLFLAMKSPDIEIMAKEDTVKAFQYLKKHYWDYVSFNDDRLIRTPVFHNKLDYYFSSIVHPAPDSIMQEVDAFLVRLNEGSEMYKHSLWYLTLKYDQSNRMGYDAILVHFSDHYYTKGKAAWLNSTVLKNIIDEAQKRRYSLIGQAAPNMVMQDLQSKPISMYDIDKNFTLLYFWDPNCGHCKEETPKLKTFYDEHSKTLDLEVFAVCADTNLKAMKSYIFENKLNWINVNGPRSYTQNFHELYNVYSTPSIFILDKNKTIIAKQIDSDQIREFLNNYQITKLETNEIQF